MDFLINGVADFLNNLASNLPQWTFIHDISADVQTITPYLQRANVLLPVDTFLEIFSLFIGLSLVLIALYWLDRVINLLRGAG